MSNNEQNETNDNETSPQPVSRRDFLRRAGKEAITTGASLVPGAALAKTVLIAPSEKETPGDEETGETAAAQKPQGPSVWRWIVGRRDSNRKPEGGAG